MKITLDELTGPNTAFTLGRAFGKADILRTFRDAIPDSIRERDPAWAAHVDALVKEDAMRDALINALATALRNHDDTDDPDYVAEAQFLPPVVAFVELWLLAHKVAPALVQDWTTEMGEPL